jgi:D-glycero-D-manno-heptose 1,7-bisphosphate phosphatase
MRKRAVFLDRDGTIVEDIGFVRRVEDVKLLPQAAEALARLNRAGWAVVVVTNQSGVARGLLSEKDVAATNERMKDLLKKQGAHVDAVYYCPHLPEGKVTEYAIVCGCRKPRPGMILKAAQDLDIDLANSVTVGDAPRDVEAGLSAGTRAILLTQSATRADQAPDACGQAPDLLSAVEEIVHLPSATPPAGPEPKKEPKPLDAAKPGEKPQPEVTPAVPEAPATAEPPLIPVHRAPKEFVPEPELPQEPPVEAKKPAAAPREKAAAPVEEKAKGPEVEAAAAPAAVRAEAPVREKPAAARPAPAERAEPAAAGAATCGRCGRTVRAADIESGRAFNKDGVCLCEACVSAMRAEKAPARPSGGAARGKAVTNEDLLHELQNISRALTYERFSFWHIFGAIAQALAIGSLVIMRMPPEGLLWAIFFQLLALTFFVLGRL